MKKLQFPAQTSAPEEGRNLLDGINAWAESEVGLQLFKLYHIQPHHDRNNYSIFGCMQMLDRVLATSPHADIIEKALSFPIHKVVNGELSFDSSPERVVPRFAYVVIDLGLGNGVRIETVHGTHGFTIPDECVQRGEIPTPLPVMYHVPFGVFLFGSVVRIGYCHDLAIFFAEEYVRLLNEPFVKQWGVFNASNPLYRVRKPI